MGGRASKHADGTGSLSRVLGVGQPVSRVGEGEQGRFEFLSRLPLVQGPVVDHRVQGADEGEAGEPEVSGWDLAAGHRGFAFVGHRGDDRFAVLQPGLFHLGTGADDLDEADPDPAGGDDRAQIRRQGGDQAGLDRGGRRFGECGGGRGESRFALSPREREVLLLLRDGLSVPAIARSTYVSPSTAKTYIARLYEKLGPNNRAQALMTALRHGLIRNDELPAVI